MIDMEIVPDAAEIFGNVRGIFKCRYANGPILQNGNRNDLPPFTTAALFRSEVADNGTTAGVMINTPAAAYSTYGKGKVFIVSSHPENSPGLENFVPPILAWLKKI